MRRPPLAMALPLAAILSVAIVAFGLGASFIALNETAMGKWGSIVIGLILVGGVPTVAALLSLSKR